MTTTLLPEPEIEAPVDAPPGAPPTAPADPAWSRPALIGVAALALLLFTWGLSRNGYGNDFYAAAVVSATKSWKALLFGSLDPGNFITVDKPPLALWVMGLSGRIFGFSSWSMLLPEALAGVASVLVLHRLVKRWAGPVAAILAALAFALTPIAVAMFRVNNPDAVLTLLLLLGAWGTWSAIETGRTRPLVLAGTAVGAAFLTKMLQAFLVLPAFGLVYLLFGPPRLARRIVQLVWFCVALVVSAGWWVALVELWPASSRPYIGGSTNNSVLDLVFGYNGLSRLTGGGGGGPRGGGPGGGGGFGGAAGWLRMFNPIVGGQISWLLPFAAAGLVAGLLVAGRAARTDRWRAGFVLWGLWTFVHVAVFSLQQGIFHPYYTVALAPGVAALAGGGAVALWRLHARRPWGRWLLPASVIVTAIWAVVLLGRTPSFVPWLIPLILAAALGSAVALGMFAGERHRMVAVAAIVAAVAVLAGPAAYAFDTMASSQTGALIAAGPATAATAGPGGAAGPGPARAFGDFPGGPSGPTAGGFGGPPAGGGTGAPGQSARPDQSLVSYLESHRGGATYLVAVEGSQQAEGLILATGQPVVAMGGFSGGDPAPTAAQLAAMVRNGELRYVMLGGGAGGRGGPGGGGPGGGGPGDQSVRTERDAWVTTNCTAVTVSGASIGSLYDCSAAAA